MLGVHVHLPCFVEIKAITNRDLRSQKATKIGGHMLSIWRLWEHLPPQEDSCDRLNCHWTGWIDTKSPKNLRKISVQQGNCKTLHNSQPWDTSILDIRLAPWNPKSQLLGSLNPEVNCTTSPPPYTPAYFMSKNYGPKAINMCKNGKILL